MQREQEDIQALLEDYQPVHSLSYYSSTRITLKGSVRPSEDLPAKLLIFLSDFGEDKTLWDGTKGILGRSYLPNNIHKTVSKTKLTSQHLKLLQMRYMEVKRNHSLQKDWSLLRVKEQRQNKLQNRLQKSIADSEREAEAVRRRIQEYNCSNPKNREQQKTLLSVLHQANREVAKSMKASAVLEAEILQTQNSISEHETGFLLRYAILQVVWNEPSSRASCLRSVSQGESRISFVAASKKAAGDATFKFLQAKRLYIDCKLGLAGLYKVESTLKAILENLRQAMDAYNGVPTSSDGNIALPNEKGVNYRLSYVHRLWISIDPCFKTAAFPYVKKTSFRTGPLSSKENHVNATLTSVFDADGRKDTIGSVFEETKDYGTFSKPSAILPKYSKVEHGHLVRTRKRITAMHKAAASAYKFINDIYDSQTKWVDAAYEEFVKREKDWFTMNEKLIMQWENLMFG